MTKKLAATLCAILLLAGCSQPDNPGNTIPRSRTFHYQLQNATYENLRQLKADYLVLDPDNVSLAELELAQLRQSGKTVLSYLSIGEAETYRQYWQPNWRVGEPNFIDRENPNWTGNYKVRYWYPQWQELILRRVQEITALGYDGVYLDIVDAYDYYKKQGRETAAEEMIDFVKKIANTGRLLNKRFLIVPQNSPELYQFDEYKILVDGLGIEDTWYNDDTKQAAQERDYVLSFLEQAAREGKFILAIDYPTKNKNICDFYNRCNAHGFACAVSNRELDQKQPTACK